MWGRGEYSKIVESSGRVGVSGSLGEDSKIVQPLVIMWGDDLKT